MAIDLENRRLRCWLLVARGGGLIRWGLHLAGPRYPVKEKGEDAIPLLRRAPPNRQAGGDQKERANGVVSPQWSA